MKSVVAHAYYHGPQKVEAGPSSVAYLVRPCLKKCKAHERHKMGDILAIIWNNFSIPKSFS